MLNRCRKCCATCFCLRSQHVRAHTRDRLKDNKNKNRVYACNRMRIMRVETWKKVRAGCACACARLFIAILTFFAFLFVLWIFYSPLFRRSSSSFSFSFFFFFVCVCTHARFCVLYISPRTLRLHEAARGTFFSLHFQILLLYASRLLQATSLFTASTFVYVLFLSLWAKVSCIYIYIYFYTYVYYIYICICVYNCFCRFSHVSHRFLPWPTSLKKLFGYEKETKRENRPADEREKEM